MVDLIFRELLVGPNFIKTRVEDGSLCKEILFITSIFILNCCSPAVNYLLILITDHEESSQSWKIITDACRSRAEIITAKAFEGGSIVPFTKYPLVRYSNCDTKSAGFSNCSACGQKKKNLAFHAVFSKEPYDEYSLNHYMIYLRLRRYVLII